MATLAVPMASQLFDRRGTVASSPVAILTRFLAAKTTTLTMKGDFSIFTGTSFTVKNASDESRILTVEGTTRTVQKPKKFLDAEGNHIFTLKMSPAPTSPLITSQTHYIEAPSGQRIVGIEFTRTTNTDAEITFANAITGMGERLSLSGKKTEAFAEIKDLNTGEVVATKEGKAKKSTVTVARSMDMALAVAVFVCYDEVLRTAK